RGVVIDSSGAHAYVLAGDQRVWKIELQASPPTANPFTPTPSSTNVFGADDVTLSGLAIDGTNHLYTWANHATDPVLRRAFVISTQNPGANPTVMNADGLNRAALPAQVT